MYKYIDKIIYDFYKNKIIFVYIFYILLVTLLSLFFTYQLTIKLPGLIDNDNNIIIPHIQFGYGPLIENLYNGQGYIKIWNGADNYLSRLPFVPIFTTLILNLTLEL